MEDAKLLLSVGVSEKNAILQELVTLLLECHQSHQYQNSVRCILVKYVHIERLESYIFKAFVSLIADRLIEYRYRLDKSSILNTSLKF